MKRFTITLLALFYANITLAQEPINRTVQIGLVSPLGTNGNQSSLCSNAFSFNILGGHSHSTRGFELGGLYNINLNHTTGVQIGGLFNVTGGNVHGVQVGGLFNVSNGTLRGVQIGGLFNYASTQRGFQLGLINIMDKCEGLSLGLINIAKKGGKYQAEIGFSELLHTSISFKLGTDQFYTIFSGGMNYIDTQELNFGVGLGFGTDIKWAEISKWSNQIELMGYGLTEKGKFTSELNMLGQFRVMFERDLGSVVSIFFGPTLNMTFSQYTQASGAMGCTYLPYSMWDLSTTSLSMHAWVGFSAGVRLF